MPCGRCQVAVPDCLTVVVGVNIDKAGSDDAVPGFDLFQAVALEAPDACNASAAYGNVTFAASSSGSVCDRSIADDEIEPCAHRSSPLLTAGRNSAKHLGSTIASQSGCWHSSCGHWLNSRTTVEVSGRSRLAPEPAPGTTVPLAERTTSTQLGECCFNGDGSRCHAVALCPNWRPAICHLEDRYRVFGSCRSLCQGGAIIDP